MPISRVAKAQSSSSSIFFGVVAPRIPTANRRQSLQELVHHHPFNDLGYGVSVCLEPPLGNAQQGVHLGSWGDSGVGLFVNSAIALVGGRPQRTRV